MTIKTNCINLWRLSFPRDAQAVCEEEEEEQGEEEERRRGKECGDDHAIM